jgi:hypothetical protein
MKSLREKERMTESEIRNRAADFCKASGDTDTARADAYKKAGIKDGEDMARHRAAAAYHLERRIREDDGTKTISDTPLQRVEGSDIPV